jgi:hypothetical protein
LSRSLIVDTAAGILLSLKKKKQGFCLRLYVYTAGCPIKKFGKK